MVELFVEEGGEVGDERRRSRRRSRSVLHSGRVACVASLRFIGFISITGFQY
jgi:hypothetical protein